jgi:hypothetical protein
MSSSIRRTRSLSTSRSSGSLHRFARQFYVALGLFPLLIAALVVWTKASAADPWGKPAYPVPGRNFVAEYGVVGADAAHIIYYWGLFGMAERIRQAQLLLLGSSHTQFGLSARQLSQDLSADPSRPVRAFNVGMGCGESALFGAKILKRLGVQDKAVVADLFNTDALTPCSQAAEHADAFDAYFKVFAIWSKFTWDWLLDGNLPTVMLQNGTATVSRALAGAIVIVDWRYGDVSYCARPSRGMVFPSDEAGTAYPVDGDHGATPTPVPAQLPADPRLLATLSPLHDSPALTLIPFSGEKDYWSRLLREDNAGSDLPFVAVSGRALSTFDHNHLTGDSRAVATDRLLRALRQGGLLSPI